MSRGKDPSSDFVDDVVDDTASDRVRRCRPVLAVDTVDSDDFMPMVFPEDLAEDFRRLTAIL